jgi:hypothetical protein
MTLAGRHHDSLLIPPLELTWREAGALGDLAGCEALIHAYTKPDCPKTIAKETKYRNLFETILRENVAPIVSQLL